MFFIWMLWNDRGNFLLLASAQKDFSYWGALFFFFFAPWVQQESELLFFGVVSQINQVEEEPEESSFVHISALGVPVHPCKCLLTYRCVDSFQLRDLPGVTVLLAVSTPVSPVTQNLYMGQFPRDGNLPWFLSVFLSLNTCCDQIIRATLVFSTFPKKGQKCGQM